MTKKLPNIHIVMTAGLLACCLCISSGAGAVTLTDALTEAYRNNPGLEAERAKLRATDENVSLALSNWRPHINATSGFGKVYQSIPALGQQGQKTDYANTATNYGLEVTQPLFRGFRTIHETKSAKSQVFAGRANLEEAEQKLFLDTATAFLGIVRDKSIHDSLRATETVIEGILKETTARAQSGELSTTDVEQVRAKLARINATRVQAENSLATNREAYRRLTGNDAGDCTAPNLNLDVTSLDDALSHSTQSNPLVIAARYNLDQATADIANNKGILLPEVSLVGAVSRNYAQSYALPGETDTKQIMVQLKMPLYDGGSNYARIRATQQVSVQKRMELQDALDRAREGARKSWQDLQSTKAIIEADKYAITANTKSLEGVRAQVRAGIRTTLDALNAEQELLDSKNDLVRATYDHNMAILNIKASMGLLTAENLGLPINLYDPTKYYNNNHNRWIGYSNSDAEIYRHDRTDSKTSGARE